MNPPRSLIREKTSLWLEFKRVKSEHGRPHPLTVYAWNQFARINSEIKYFAINSQIQYEKKIADQIGSKPKLFHSYLDHRRVGRPGIGPISANDGTLSDDPYVMSETFAEAFSSVYSLDTPNNPAPNQICFNQMEALQVTPDEVFEILSSLDCNTSMGSDGVHPRLLNRLAGSLCIPLSLIYTSSLRESLLPR